MKKSDYLVDVIKLPKRIIFSLKSTQSALL
jgi:hypothetical protein